MAKDRIRNVASQEGVRYYGAPMGTPITAGLRAKAKARHGGKSYEQWKAESGGGKAPAGNRPAGRAGDLADAVNAANTPAELDRVQAAARKEMIGNKIKQADYDALKTAIANKRNDIARGKEATPVVQPEAPKPGTKTPEVKQRPKPKNVRQKVEDLVNNGLPKKDSDNRAERELAAREAAQQKKYEGLRDRVDNARSAAARQGVLDDARLALQADDINAVHFRRLLQHVNNAADVSQNRRQQADEARQMERARLRVEAAKKRGEARAAAKKPNTEEENRPERDLARMDNLVNRVPTAVRDQEAVMERRAGNATNARHRRRQLDAAEEQQDIRAIYEGLKADKAAGRLDTAQFRELAQAANEKYKNAGNDGAQRQFDAAIARINGAKNVAELEAIAQDFHDRPEQLDRIVAGDRKKGQARIIRNNDLKRQLNRQMDAKARELAQAEEADRIARVKAQQEANAQAQAALVKPDSPEEFISQVTTRLDAADTIPALDAIIDDFEANADDLSDDEFNKVVDYFNALKDRHNLRKAIEASPRRAAIERAQAAQQAHFDGGGTIGDAPGEGLFDFIKMNPKRFSAKSLGEDDAAADDGGQSLTYRIVDQQTGEVYFAKTNTFTGDYAREVMANKAANALGFDKSVGKVAFGGAFDHFRYNKKGAARGAGGGMGKSAKPSDPIYIVRDAMQGNEYPGKLSRMADVGKNQIVKDEDISKSVRNGDPASVIELALFDFLVNNRVDRHQGNFFVAMDGTKARVIPIDQGLAFSDNGIMAKGADADPSQTFASYARRARFGDDNGAIRQIGLDYFSNDKERMRQALDGILTRWEKADMDQVAAEFEAAFAGADDTFAKQEGKKMADILRGRLKTLLDDRDAIIAVL